MPDDTTDLAAQSCVPCRGGVPPLAQDEAARLLQQVPAWSLCDDAHRIERRWKFRNFNQAFEFVAKAAALAETEGHHPDIALGWGYVTVSLQTHKIKGLHPNDFIMAAKLDRIAAGAPAAG
jgi:4a-hydroxytetrahydrobiopterin dehydratase